MIFPEAVETFEKVMSEVFHQYSEVFHQYKEYEKYSEDNRAYTVEKEQRKYPNAYKPWKDDDDKKLEIMYCEGETMRGMVYIFGRGKGALRSRIRKLELEEKYGTKQALE